jgi:glycosyltransferase involved in cell wall biosynthesis
MKRILAIDQGEYIGGAEIFLAEILKMLSVGERLDVHLLTSGTGKYLEMYRKSGVKIHQVDLPQLKPFSIRTLLRFRRAAAALAKKMAEIKPDLVVSNTVRTHILSSAAASKNKIPLLWFAHDVTFSRILLKRFIRFPKTIICCSKYVRDFYASTLPHRSISKMSPSFEVVYPFGISKEEVDDLVAVAPDKFSPAASAKSRVVGMVGNFIPWKGQYLFIKMAAAIHTQHPDCRFEIIGRTYEGNTASKKYRAECDLLAAPLIAEAAPLNAKKVLTIRESVPSAIEEMAKWQILVHCSKEPEPLGRVILEGMAAGCAVIASNLGGPREIINSADYTPTTAPDGILIQPNAESLTKAVSTLLGDSEKMRLLSQNARAKILNEFQRKKVFMRISEIISGL